MSISSRARMVQVLLVVCAVLVIVGGARAEGVGDRAELEAWMDGAMNAHLAAYHSAGAVVSVVKDGELFFSKGYGYADVQGRVKVDPAKTLFRIGSVSKLFVWTAVMQLVEEGRLDLQADVNTYLTDVKVPERFGGPVTMANLMSHTPGFEDVVIGLFARDESAMAPLSEILQREMPKRVRYAGQYASYSNHGTGLAMHVVEEISGMSWGDYIQQRIISPLGMEQFTFDQPLPERLAGDMSKGYRWQGNVFKEQDFEFVPLGPVGAGSACADEMATFMIAHLQLGRLGEVTILEEDTARLMQSELHRMATGVNPMAHGFIDSSQNGQRVIGHGGATLWFKTMLALLPEHNVGIFVSHNTDAGSPGALVEQFLDTYYPEPEAPLVEAPVGFDERSGKYAGTYRVNRHSYTTLFKANAAVNTLTISPSGDGALHLSSTGGVRWIETGALTFREELGHRTIVFRENERGKITHMLFGNGPTAAFDKDGMLDSPVLHRQIVMVAVGLFVFTFFLWPVAALVRWRYDVLVPNHEMFPRTARVIAWTSCLLFLLFLGGLVVTMGDRMQLVFGIPYEVEILLYLPMVGAVLVLAALVYTGVIWWKGMGRIVSRAYYTVLTVASVLFVSVLFYWNLLGHRY